MIAKLICPSCQTLGQFSVLGGSYKGPYRCWKCRTLYTIDIENGEAISWLPMAEKELEDLKAQQDAEKKGIKPDVKPQSASQPASPPLQNPLEWPRKPNKVTPEPEPEIKQPESPKQPFWPRMPENKPKVTTPSGSPPAAPTVLPGETPVKKSNGIILFKSNAELVQAEKLLYNEGCTATRVTAPVEPASDCNIALRFPWSQYETVKAVLEKAGVQTLRIRQMSS
jgi:hypothetical protein